MTSPAEGRSGPGTGPAYGDAVPSEDRSRAGPAVVLVGPPGAGKTSVAQALGRLLDLPVRDTDRDVEQRAGVSVAEIFVHDGEPRFRDLEREAVVDALAGHRGVLALGSGAVLDPRTEADLAGHPVVFLDVSVTHAARRIGFTKDRPILLVNPRAEWVRMMDGRRTVYERVATARVQTDGRTVDEVASDVASVMTGRR
jgi:shikimate kinase